MLLREMYLSLLIPCITDVTHFTQVDYHLQENERCLAYMQATVALQSISLSYYDSNAPGSFGLIHFEPGAKFLNFAIVCSPSTNPRSESNRLIQKGKPTMKQQNGPTRPNITTIHNNGFISFLLNLLYDNVLEKSGRDSFLAEHSLAVD